ncbi:MAG: TldD/PmbA family protein [Terriglobales bacterium]
MRACRFVLLIATLWCVAAYAQDSSQDAVLKTMKQELTRSYDALKKAPVAPYFLSYQLTDNRAISVEGNFGALTGSSDRTTRLLDLDLRVGDYKFDNTHRIEGGGAEPRGFNEISATIPLENDADGLAVALWLATDREYKEAVQRFQAVKTSGNLRKTDGTEKKDDGDFSKAPAEIYSESLADFHFNRSAWEAKVRNFSRPFADYNDIINGSVTVMAEVETRRYVNSDGSAIRISAPFYRVMVAASIRATDGEVLPIYRDWMSFTPEGLPSDEEVNKTVGDMISTLLKLAKAPIEEPYTGPAILSGRAAAVFFHEIFGHRIEGDRLNDDDDAQTFKKRINQPVLPPFLSVYSDPTLKRIGSTELVGYYPFDDEGVKARRVTVVQNGVFKSFLTSRTPLTGFPESNGHGRRQQGHNVEARQSNLIVEAGKTVSREELKKKLISKVKAAKKPYGLFFDDIQGGFTFTQRSMPNAFSVNPTVVYRIYPDGREELVRGLDLIGTPLIAFSKISAADDQPGIFNGVCGAESGWVPVSASAPGILIDQIEVQRKEKSQERLPILPDPSHRAPETKAAGN